MSAELSCILLVAHLLHPINGFAVQLFLNGNMGHCRRWRCSVPMLLSRCKPDDIAGPDLLDWAAPALRATTARHDNQSLTERVRMPCGASAGLEGNTGANNTRGVTRLKQRIDLDRARKVLRWSLARRLGAVWFDLHGLNSPVRSGINDHPLSGFWRRRGRRWEEHT